MQAHDERGVEVHDAHGAGADHGGVAGAGKGLVGAVVGLEDAEGVAEAWMGVRDGAFLVGDGMYTPQTRPSMRKHAARNSQASLPPST